MNILATPRSSFEGRARAQVELDNQTSSAYSVINVVCRDRKGLVYDMMRTLKDIQIRVGYAKIKVAGQRAEADIFVQEEDGKRIELCASPQPHPLQWKGNAAPHPIR